MSEQLLPPPQPPCNCQAEVKEWKVKYSKLEEKRGALRQAVKLLEQQIDKVQADNHDLKRAYEEERLRVEKEGKERESAIRVSLENEISSLKSEISSLQQAAASGSNHENEKVSVLEAKLAAGERETNRLKDLLKKEKSRTDSEKKNAESEKRRANEAWKTVEGEKSKVDEQRKILERKSEEHQLLVESLKKEADEIRENFGLETSKLMEAKKKLEFERQQLMKERKRADMDKARAEEQRKLVEVNVKKLMEEKCRADNLSRQVEESSRMIVKLQKEIADVSTKMTDHPIAGNKVLGTEIAKKENGHRLGIPRTEASNLIQHQTATGATKQFDAEKQSLLNERKQADSDMKKAGDEKSLLKKYKKRALKEKCRTDELRARLNVEGQRNKQLQQQQLEHSSRKQAEVQTGHSSATDTVDDPAKLKLLKKQLKLQRMKAKHAKEAADLERYRHSIVLQEVQRMKLDFRQISRRLDMLDSCFVPCCGGTYEPKENENIEMQSWRKKFYGLQSPSDELMKPYMAFIGDPTCRGSSIDFISGTDSKLELPPGGSPRKSLKHSGVNSTLASFSDRGLVGSQDMGDIIVSTPAGPLEDQLNQLTNASGLLDGNNRITSKENTAVVAENNVRCPVAINGDGLDKHGQKRKRLVDVVESVDNMCLKSRKLHLQMEEELTTLRDILMRQMERPVHDIGYLADNDPQTQQRFPNKTNSHDEKLGTETMYLDCQQKDKHPKIQAPLVANGQSFDRAHASILKEGADQQDPLLIDIMESFKLVDGDYMKLLELDNPADEQLYQLAISRPLSPTLPKIDMDCIKRAKFNEDGDTHQGVHCEVENLSPLVELGFNNMEVESSKLSFVFSENEEAKSDNQQEYWHGIFPRYFIGGYDTDDLDGISRILCAIKRCMGRCSCISNSGWSLKNILIELSMEENLLAKDKVRALFSILLLQFSAMRTFGLSLNRDSISSIDSFTEQIRNIISNGESRRLLAQLCGIDELISLVEDFLVERKVILCSERNSEELITCNKGIGLTLEGVNVLISSVAASAELLFVGSVVLAAICAAIDQINLICEASYRILCAHGSASSLVLTMLHVFAHISGGKYFTDRSYSLLITVLRSLVLFVEGGGDAAGSVCIFSHEEMAAEFSQCPGCPFSDKAVPPDVVVSLLLEELQTTVISGEIRNEGIEPITAKHDRVPPVRDNIGIKHDVQSLCDRHADSSCSKDSLTTDAKCHNTPGVYLHSDLILLVDLIAVNLGWEWTKTKILPQLLKFLESCVQERSAAAIIILLGQLGRLGVDSLGCNDTSVESLRCHLYSFLSQACNSKLGFPTQCAIVMALLSLLPLDFEKILENTATLPETASISIPAQAIGRWFSHLSEEERASTRTLLHLETVDGS